MVSVQTVHLNFVRSVQVTPKVSDQPRLLGGFKLNSKRHRIINNGALARTAFLLSGLVVGMGGAQGSISVSTATTSLGAGATTSFLTDTFTGSLVPRGPWRRQREREIV